MTVLIKKAAPPEFDRKALASEQAALTTYYERHRGAKRPRGITLDEHLADVIESHRDLWTRWGGWRFHATLPVTTTVTADDFARACDKAVRKVPSSTWAKVFDYYQLNLPRFSDVYATRTASKEVSWIEGFTDNIRIRAGQSVARAILAHVRKKYTGYPNYVKFWDILFQELGELWARRHSRILTISTAPSDWMQLGRVAGYSCYSMGGGYEISKINLARRKNSAVVYLSRDGILRPTPNTPPAWGAVIARCWIVAVPGAGFVASNAYGMALPQLVQPLMDTAPDWLGVDVKGTHELHDDERAIHAGICKRRVIFINRDTLIVGDRAAVCAGVVNRAAPPPSPVPIHAK